MSNSFIWPIDRTISGVITPGWSGCGSNGDERSTLHSAKLQRYWSLDTRYGHLTYLLRCSRCLLQHQPTGLVVFWIYHKNLCSLYFLSFHFFLFFFPLSITFLSLFLFHCLKLSHITRQFSFLLFLHLLLFLSFSAFSPFSISISTSLV